MTPQPTPPRFTLARQTVALLAACLGLAIPWPVGAADAGPAEKPAAKGAIKPASASLAAKAESTARKGAPTSQAAEPVDPVARLRERLAERLAGVKANPSGNAVELRVVNLPPTDRLAVSAAEPAAAPRARAARPGPAGAGHAKIGAHWAYNGDVGPQAWGGLRPEFSTCAKGERQSPIDIREGIAVDLEPVKFQYQASAFSVIDNGYTVQVNLAPGNSMEIGSRRYELLQFHFHRPSEERIDGRQFEMSVHLVHKDAEGRLAVVGVLLGKGAVQPVVQTVWNNLPLEKHQDLRARVQIDPNDLLPQDRRYYTYMGSLTTPPCSEGVQWVVMRQPVAATPEQIDIFSRLYPLNARPVQNAAGRRILQSN